jgi:hypothetical protein
MSDVLAELEAMIGLMPADQKAELDQLLEPELRSVWLPNPGPQTQALESQADMLLYGGAAGGGKTDLLAGTALTRHHRSLIFRRAYTDLSGFEQRLLEILGNRRGYNASDMRLERDGVLLECGALEKPGSELAWMGRPHDFIGFDEGAQLKEKKVSFVIGWLRSTRPGQRKRVVIASNPPIGGEGEWLTVWFAPWLDPLFPKPAAPGELRWCVVKGDGTIIWCKGPGEYEIEGEPEKLIAQSRTFIPAFLDDNPYLRETGYRAQIMSLPEPLRSKLLKGDFSAGKEDAANQVIPTAWVEAANARWVASGGKPKGVKMLTMGVDVAQGGPDDTVLAPLYGNWFAELVKVRGIDTKNGPAVAGLVLQHMRDRCQVNIDLTGGWGGSARDHLEAQGINVVGVVFSEGSDQMTRDQTLRYANIRTQLYWNFREALDPHSDQNIALPPDRRLKAQLTAPTWRLRGDAILIESKDDIIERLGASTDDADAVILAWHEREEALRAASSSRASSSTSGSGWAA